MNEDHSVQVVEDMDEDEDESGEDHVDGDLTAVIARQGALPKADPLVMSKLFPSGLIGETCMKAPII